MHIQQRAGDVPTYDRTRAVLLYHRMGLPRLGSVVSGQYVAPGLFRSQLRHLAARGWQATSLADLVSSGEACVDADCFAVTFDDGYLSVYDRALPVLIERRVPATVYVVAGAVGGTNDWDRRAGDRLEYMMSANHLRELADLGIEIGSHSLSHPRLSRLPDQQLKSEVSDSKRRLEDIIGREIGSFSYPYGDYNERVLAAVEDAGYRCAVTTRLGVVAGQSMFEIPRINVRWNALGALLIRKITRAQKATSL